MQQDSKDQWEPTVSPSRLAVSFRMQHHKVAENPAKTNLSEAGLCTSVVCLCARTLASFGLSCDCLRSDPSESCETQIALTFFTEQKTKCGFCH